MFLGMFYWMVLAYPFTVLVTFLGTVVLTVIVHLKSLLRAKECAPRLCYRESALAKHVLSSCASLRRNFRPPLLAQNGHAQSLLALSCLRAKAEFQRQYLHMADGGIVALDWAMAAQYLSNTSPIMVIIPDITSDALGVSAICNLATAREHRVVVFNRRGHGRSFLSTAKMQSYGDPSDLRQVLMFLRNDNPEAFVTAVGVGAGSDLLFSYLGHYGSSSYLSATACISPTYNSEEVFSQGLPKLYDYLYVSHLKKIVRNHWGHFSNILESSEALRSQNLQDFTERVYCKLYDYSGSEEMWENDNPIRDVDDISVPVLCINSLDDPLCAKENIPVNLFKSYPNFFLVTLEKGGHGGFLEGLQGPSWAETAAIEYVETVLKFVAQEEAKLLREMQKLIRPRAYTWI